MRLGLDPGDVRIGVARSDPTGFLATPVETVQRGRRDLARIREILDEIAEDSEVLEVVVGLPRSLPYFFASLKVAVTLAFVGAIISETVASRNGIGYLMMAATANFDTPLVFAGLIVTAVMGVVMYLIFSLFERRTMAWTRREGGMLS